MAQTLGVLVTSTELQPDGTQASVSHNEDGESIYAGDDCDSLVCIGIRFGVRAHPHSIYAAPACVPAHTRQS